MSYTELKTIFYKNKDLYQQTYDMRYTSDSTVHLDFTVSGNPAFFQQNTDVVLLLGKILQLDKQIALLCKQLPGEALTQYAKKCLIDEIVITNNIEGVHSSRKEIGEALAILEEQSQHKGKKVKFLGIVNKYYKLTKNETIPLGTCQDIRDLYDELVLQEVVDEDKDNMPDGQIFRKGPEEVVSSSGKVIHKGLYPEANIITAMEQALRFLDDDSIPPLFRICIFHYLLEYIHPFYDGNGRLGRFILSYCMAGQLEHLSALRISSIIKENINQYYKAFVICNEPKNLADLTPFLIFMLEMIHKTEEELIHSLDNGLQRWNKYESLIQTVFKSSKEIDYNFYSVLIQAALFSEQGIPTKGLLAFLHTTRTTLKVKLSDLDKAHLLVESKHGKEKFYQMNLAELDLLAQK